MAYLTWEQIANIPWPFYAFIYFLLYSIYRTTKPSIIPVRIYLYLPTFLILATSLYLAMLENHFSILTLFWLPGIAAGICIGMLTFKTQQVKAITGQKKIYLPGSWWTILLLAAIAGIQGTSAGVIAYYPAWQHFFNSSWFFIYGLFAGLFIGRMMYAFRCLKRGPFITLEEAKV